MDTIDIPQNIQDFKQVFEKENSIIFSLLSLEMVNLTF